jgi:hypothetical protein
MGPTGPVGATGQGFTFRSNWSRSVGYSAYDVVSYNGTAYVAKTAIPAVGAAYSSIVNVDAIRNATSDLSGVNFPSGAAGVIIPLDVGTYTITPIGPTQGGAYTAEQFCVCNIGQNVPSWYWMFDMRTSDIQTPWRVGTDTNRQWTPEVALSSAIGTSFTLANSGWVEFEIIDNPISDNSGGVSFLLSGGNSHASPDNDPAHWDVLAGGSSTAVASGGSGPTGATGSGIIGCTGATPFLTISGGNPICVGKYINNGDGTLTDNSTGLMWELATGVIGTPNPADVKDVNATYQWAAGSDVTPRGTLFRVFLSALNGGVYQDTSSNSSFELVYPIPTACFASHCDWRIPSISELATIVSANICASTVGPCIDPVFGPTQSWYYWSNSTYDVGGSGTDYRNAWDFGFMHGGVASPYLKTSSYYARAVRSIR